MIPLVFCTVSCESFHGQCKISVQDDNFVKRILNHCRMMQLDQEVGYNCKSITTLWVPEQPLQL